MDAVTETSVVLQGLNLFLKRQQRDRGPHTHQGQSTSPESSSILHRLSSAHSKNTNSMYPLGYAQATSMSGLLYKIMMCSLNENVRKETQTKDHLQLPTAFCSNITI